MDHHLQLSLGAAQEENKRKGRGARRCLRLYMYTRLYKLALRDALGLTSREVSQVEKGEHRLHQASVYSEYVKVRSVMPVTW